ncbi:MAG: type II toxin-antitoxin system YoeB family toxin [Lamprocystis purpurea]|nr:type II toxin-antitoxin system YoeB family toxin [Lamprocystis purpurea]
MLIRARSGWDFVVDSIRGHGGQPPGGGENLSGFWSRRIDDGNRLVYAVDDDHLTLVSCRYHY